MSLFHLAHRQCSFIYQAPPLYCRQYLSFVSEYC